jgi:hypothetical protein
LTDELGREPTMASRPMHWPRSASTARACWHGSRPSSAPVPSGPGTPRASRRA